MLIILLLHLLDLLILRKDTIGSRHVAGLHTSHLPYHICNGFVLLVIGLRKLLAHSLVHGRSISCILFLCLFQLIQCHVEITELHMERIVHLF